VIDRARARLETRLGQARAGAAGSSRPEPDGLTERQLRRELIAAQNAELVRLFDGGQVSDATRQRLQHSLDLEAAGLSDDQV